MHQGGQWPPSREQRRIYDYEAFHRYSNGRYAGLWPDPKNPARLKQNSFRWLMDFWADAVLSGGVTLTAPTDRAQAYVDVLTPALLRSGRRVVGDMIRYGVGVWVNEAALLPQAVDPRWWLPVRAPWDDEAPRADLITIPYREREPVIGAHKYQYGVQDQDRASGDRLLVRTFWAGGIETAFYRIEGLTLGDRLGEPRVEAGAGEGRGVVPVANGQGFYGRSDYIDILDFVMETHRRESQLSVALDKHVHPHLGVPEGSITYDAQGNAVINSDGMVFPVPEGGVLPGFISWDPEFEHHERAIRRSERRIWEAAKVAPVLVETDREGAGRTYPASGEALRRAAAITVDRIKAIRAELSDAMKLVVVGALERYAALGGELVVLEPGEIEVEWPPELGEDVPVGEGGVPAGEGGGDGGA